MQELVHLNTRIGIPKFIPNQGEIGMEKNNIQFPFPIPPDQT